MRDVPLPEGEFHAWVDSVDVEASVSQPLTEEAIVEDVMAATAEVEHEEEEGGFKVFVLAL